MKVLITGANGQLGQTLQHFAPAWAELFAADKSRCDLTQPVQLQRLFQQWQPDLVINTAAFTAVDLAEQQPEQAILINHQGVEQLAKVCRQYQTKLIHISTDYVFAGSGTTALKEDDIAQPRTIYGQSKLAGELALKQIMAERALIVRSSGIYSHYGVNIVRTLLKLMQRQQALSVVNDQVCTPTSAAWLSQWLWSMASSEQLFGRTEVFHASAAGQCSWYEFALELAAKALQHGVITEPANIRAVSSDEYQRLQQKVLAPRPAFSVLDSQKLRQKLPQTWLSWQQMLADYFTNNSCSILG